MSVLSPEIHAALTPLLQALSSPDNAVRTNAEAQLNSEWVAVRPDVLLMGLVEQIQDNRDPSVGDAMHICSLCLDRTADESLNSDANLRSCLVSADGNQESEATEQYRAKGIVPKSIATTKDRDQGEASTMSAERGHSCCAAQDWRCSCGDCQTIRRRWYVVPAVVR